MSAGPVRVVVVDDHPMFRAGLRTMVEEAAGVELVGEADGGDLAVEVCTATAPDVVLMDIQCPAPAALRRPGGWSTRAARVEC